MTKTVPAWAKSLSDDGLKDWSGAGGDDIADGDKLAAQV